jgi:hypothetical protein
MLRVFFTKILIWKEKSEITIFKCFRRILNEFKQIVWEDFNDINKPLLDEEECEIFRENFQHWKGFTGWDIDSGVTTQRKQREANNMSFDNFNGTTFNDSRNHIDVSSQLDFTLNNSNILADLNGTLDTGLTGSAAKKSKPGGNPHLDETLKKNSALKIPKVKKERAPLPEAYYQNGCHKFCQTEEDMNMFEQLKSKEAELNQVIRQLKYKQEQEKQDYHEAVVKSIKERNLILDLKVEEVLEVKEWDSGLDCKYQLPSQHLLT